MDQATNRKIAQSRKN